MSTRENIRLIARAPFACSKVRYDICHKANNIGSDQSARMRRLVCTCVIRTPPPPSKTGFLASKPIYDNEKQSTCISLSTFP